MRCKKCGGRMRVKGGWEHKGGYVRSRKCDSCTYSSMSIEVLMKAEKIKEVTGVPAWQGRPGLAPLRRRED